jgi:hypothetical protein
MSILDIETSLIASDHNVLELALPGTRMPFWTTNASLSAWVWRVLAQPKWRCKSE